MLGRLDRTHAPVSETGWSSTITAARTKPLAADHQQWSTHCKSKQPNPISRSKSELKKRQILSKEWGAPQFRMVNSGGLNRIR